MGENVKKQKKSGSINAFVIVFLVIVGCYIMSLFISPGAFDREVLNGRTVVIANSLDRKSTRLNSSHTDISRMPSSA